MLPDTGKRDWLFAGLAAGLMLALGVFRMAPGVTGVYHDDGIYIATAKALAEGEGYRLKEMSPSSLTKRRAATVFSALGQQIGRHAVVPLTASHRDQRDADPSVRTD